MEGNMANTGALDPFHPASVSAGRREFITLVGGAAVSLAWPRQARAQQQQRTTKPARIGVLASFHHPPLQRMLQKLNELGYVEGATVHFEYRFAEGHDDRYPGLAVELAALPVDLIVTSGTPASLAAKSATSTIPIVMGSVGEAISTGIVASLARPGGNITGFSAVTPELETKRLEVLKELNPRLSRVGMLANVANPLLHVSLRNLRPAADTLGLALDIFEVRDRNDIGGALLKLVQARPDAALIAADTLLLNNRREIVDAFAKGNLPAMYPFREYVEVGGLLIHGANIGVLFERAAAYVDRILKGTKPGDLPVQQATEFELIINLKTAKTLGLDVPPQLLARADEVIE
jgi:putative ABC transport system substrate-binding protein